MRLTCRHCLSTFDITQDDLTLLEKLSPEIRGKRQLIPPPTLCPDCRCQRRMSYRNERQLYRRTCDVTGKNIISVFPSDSPHTVCEKNHWYSDAFDPMTYGQPYDANRSFFDQFHALSLTIPLPSLRIERSENCDFNNDMSDSQNCYLCSRTHMCQDLLYTYRGNKSQDSVDCTQITGSIGLYGCTECVNCQESRFLAFCSDCAMSAYLIDCRNCMDCFLCSNLRGKQYCFGNEQLTRETYSQRLKEFHAGSWASQHMVLARFEEMRHRAIRPSQNFVQCEHCSGDNLQRCKNCADCFSSQGCSDCRHLRDVKQHHDCMDEYSGGRESELVYETTSGSASYGVAFCLRASNSHQILYSYFISSSRHLFGCIGLQRKEYCILNKQYTQEEYGKIVEKIIERMKKDGEWGEFFPVNMSPFSYNETVANDFFPMTEEQVRSAGWRWWPQETTMPDVARIIPADQLPDSIDEIPDDILNWAIRCSATGRPFKVTAQELAYYRGRSIPVPREHPDVRYRARMAWQTPYRLWQRTCRKCGKETASSFSPERPEVVYCESCYLKEVY